MSQDAIATVVRELLVRHLEAWAPAALHRGRRATYVHAGPFADAALTVLADQPGLARGRELTMLVVGADAPPLTGGPAGLAVHSIPPAALGAGLKALATKGNPLFAYVADPALTPLLTSGDVLSVAPAAPAGPWDLTTAVELATDDAPGQVVFYGTRSGKSLEAFKEALWAVDEFAGVRYRDPRDPEHHLIDISLTPHPGPLRREILVHLERSGPATVTELRTFTLTETIYRAADTNRVLHTLIDAGTLTRTPGQGRLGGDVVITLV